MSAHKYAYVPNTLTSLRIVLAVFIFLEILIKNYDSALLLFLLALATDYLDGAIARKYNAVTKLGGDILETVADAAVVIFALGGLLIVEQIPNIYFWIVGIGMLGYLLFIRTIKNTRTKKILAALEPTLDGVSVGVISIWLTYHVGGMWWFLTIGFLLVSIITKRQRLRELLGRWGRI